MPLTKTFVKLPWRCKLCKKLHIVEFDMKDFADWYTRHKPIEKAFWYLKENERHIMETGECLTCIKELPPKEKDKFTDMDYIKEINF